MGLCHHRGVSSTITIISLAVESPKELEEMSLATRRTTGRHWTFPIKSGVLLDLFFMHATKSDFGVYAAGEYFEGDKPLATYMIDHKTLVKQVAKLEKLVEKNAAETAKKLHEHGKKSGDLARIEAALGSDDWPTSGDPAEEAAAFGHYLLLCAREGAEYDLGACWEYRGTLPKSD